MAVEFLQRYQGRRMSGYPDQPVLDIPGGPEDGSEEGAAGAEPAIDHGLETPAEQWEPLDVGRDAQPGEDERPRRFVDGSNVHESVAWLRGPEGWPVPVILAELGGVCIAADGRDLRREFAVVERAVAMALDGFPWSDVEELAADLAEAGLRLLPARPPEADPRTGKMPSPYDFERLREQARVAVLHEMAALEEVAWGHQPALPTLVDGRLGRFHRCRIGQYDVVGVIKQQKADYLHPQGWRVLYSLKPGQQTAFLVPSKHLEVVSWYLKLAGADGELPNWGIVRVEISKDAFARRGDDFSHIDRLSGALMEMRCRQGSYARAPVSLDPIVRAEDSLKSLFTSIPALARHFYRMTGI